MYGAQTWYTRPCSHSWFENDVEMYGAQTLLFLPNPQIPFENDVEMYGAQTRLKNMHGHFRLRMM